jgi:simple sugar transport system ATP-binding protein
MAGERDTAKVTKQELANLMVGRNVVLTVKRESKKIEAEPVFSLSQIHVKSDKGIEAVSGISLDIKPGEVVGVAGVDGNGQTELAEAIMGLRPIESGSITFLGKEISGLQTKKRILQRISNVPADRHRYGLVLPMEVSENIVIGYHDRSPFVRGFTLDLEKIQIHSEELVRDFDIRTPSVAVPAANLSGGNQQKVILAREFSRDPLFLLVSQPTRGLDVGAIEYIHSQVLKMRDKNVAILLISLELEEIFALSDRILVIYEGKMVRDFVTEETDEMEVGFHMMGGKEKE